MSQGQQISGKLGPDLAEGSQATSQWQSVDREYTPNILWNIVIFDIYSLMTDCHWLADSRLRGSTHDIIFVIVCHVSTPSQIADSITRLIYRYSVPTA
eukprot:1191801-Prorocentrum_minimum.AAC.1